MSQQAEKRITVLLVEDDAVTRRSLGLAIEKEPALQLLDALDSVQTATEFLKRQAPDILLVDLGLPDGSGIDVIRFCALTHPHCGIMVITVSSDEDSVLDSIEAGASAYLLKDAGRPDIARALLDLHAGGSPISPSIARKVLARMRGAKGEASKETAIGAASGEPPVFLTKRETSILELIARGDSYSDVARELALSVGTVQTHIKNIYDKLSVHSRGAAVYEANRRGLLQMSQLKGRT
ncbi:MAG TPA: response regulator transcription factor [Oxalicibacterium sp.]|jgi:DNA-binding NarL/FixJ family response regulator|nr:response regulator transcription factor [Oxalicibacterium sp.]